MTQPLKILITGASSGIGLTTALHLIARGHRVVGTSRHPEQFDRMELRAKVMRDHGRYRYRAGKLEQTGSRLPRELADLDLLLEKLIFIRLDPSQESSVGTGIGEALSALEGRIDILISNAGLGIFGPVEEVSAELIQQQFEANVFGHLRVVKLVLPVMRAQKQGKILFTSSIGAIMAIPFQSHYSASKIALERLAEGLSMETAPFGIQVAVVEPGDLNTNYNRTTAKAISSLPDPTTSLDLESLHASLQVPASSPYFPRARNAWRYIVASLPLKPSPSVAARCYVRLVEAKHLRAFRYRAGDPGQTIPAQWGRRLLPDKLVEWLYTLIYELNRK